MDLTLGDIAGYLQFVKSSVASTTITNFDQLFDTVEQILKTFNGGIYWTPDVESGLHQAEQELKAHPELFQIGQATFISSVDAILAKYPASTLLKDIPEFGGGGSSGGDGGTTGVDSGPFENHKGSGGIDLATIKGLVKDATVTYDATSNTIHFKGLGVDTTMSGIERLQFTDGVLAFDKDGNGIAGQAYRLYQAVFDRTPDTGGLGFWIKSLDAGQQNLVTAAASFIHSNEFQTKYGTPDTVSNADFLKLIYHNVLDRDADASGLAYWSEQMAHGTAWENVMASFSDSNENRANVATAISDGIWYT